MDAESRAFLDALARQHYSHVLNLCRKLINIRGDHYVDPQDLAQKIFELACIKAPTITTHENPVGWLNVASKMIYRKMTQSKAYQNHFSELRLEDFPDILQLEDIRSSIAFDDALEGASSISSPIFEIAKHLNSEDYLLFQHLFVLQTDRETLSQISRISEPALRKRISRMRSRLWQLWQKEIGKNSR